MDPALGRRAEVEQYILELIAEEKNCDVEQLREELTAQGADMPYDSVLLVELMVRVEARFGVKLPTDLPTARDMRSIRSFAERVCDQLTDPAPTEPEAAR
ncbi:acyl carrier protein [Amycolatopsis sp. lyj-23]|uniref:acyl carrier protein n=1 Tax=Amycolatopsis sp. lyj-23 TaxID=2789283 RepID=UPI00397A952F